MRYLFILCCLIICSCTDIPTKRKSIKKFVDPRDGERYTYIEIDDRYWMRENMRYNVPGSKLNPDNSTPLYGRLYTWEQAMKACPEGWWLSTNLDWLSLEHSVIPDIKERVTRKTCRGKKAKLLLSKKYWPAPGTDSLRMNVLPAGDFTRGKFTNLGQIAGFWTSSSHIKGGLLAETYAYYRIFTDDRDCIYYNIQDKNIHYSCRCVKDKENNPYLDL
jgi:uncharacterized protein (TIGR02145 family)